MSSTWYDHAMAQRSSVATYVAVGAVGFVGVLVGFALGRRTAPAATHPISASTGDQFTVEVGRAQMESPST